MNNKIIASVLITSFTLVNCNFNACFANDYQSYNSSYFCCSQKENLEDELERIQSNKIECERKIKELETQIQREKLKNKKNNSSFFNSFKRTFKNIFVANLGVIANVGAFCSIFLALAAIGTGGVAAYDCYNDDKCHFDDKTFFKKFKKENFAKTFSYLLDLFSKYMNDVHFVYVQKDK